MSDGELADAVPDPRVTPPEPRIEPSDLWSQIGNHVQRRVEERRKPMDVLGLVEPGLAAQDRNGSRLAELLQVAKRQGRRSGDSRLIASSAKLRSKPSAL